MFCKGCGSQLPEGARFCTNCGASTGAADGEQPTLIQPTEIRPPRDATPPPPPAAPPAPTPVPPPVYTPPASAGYPAAPPADYQAPPAPPRPTTYATPPARPNRLGLWLGIAAAVVILAAAGVTIWRVILVDNETPTTTTVAARPTTTKTVPSTTTSTSQPATSTTGSTSTTAALPSAAPGDSVGEWVEMDIPDLPPGAYAVAVSDQALLLDVEQGDGYALYAYMFDTKSYLELPIQASDFFGEDIDGTIAVWWEGDYDQDTDKTSNERIYAYALPDGPKVEVAADRGVLVYPQVSGSWVTWVQSEPFPESPEDYALYHVYGVKVDGVGAPQGDPVELVPEATAFTQGDAGWTYTLSGDHLAWENATAVGAFEPGVYRMDLESRQPTLVGGEVWRPSLGGKSLVFSEAGLMITGADGGSVKTLDASGDFAAAASTFAAYFRSIQGPDGTAYQIVARGFTGAYEQVLGEQSDAPWLSPFIAASDRHVAFIIDGTAHVFEWQGLKTY